MNPGIVFHVLCSAQSTNSLTVTPPTAAAGLAYEAMWGICFLGVPKTQKSPQPGAHFMSKPTGWDKSPGLYLYMISINNNHYVTTDPAHCVTFKLAF